MMLFHDIDEFYPTPDSLIGKICNDVNWKNIHDILEPSAGKGNIVKYLMDNNDRYNRHHSFSIDCIEINPDLQKILKASEYRLIHDDFLSFHTFKKYDLIFMNPPFSNGVQHLLKALELQKSGGSIICILNAETIRNPYTNERKVLIQKLNELNANIEYMQNEFSCADRKTCVEIAVIKVYIEAKKQNSQIYEQLRKKYFPESKVEDVTDIVDQDYIKAAVASYNLEVESGIKLIEEYNSLSPYLLLSDSTYEEPILSLKVRNDKANINVYVKEVRKKYWNLLFKNKKFTGNMTKDQYDDYAARIRELVNYDFSYYNIKSIQQEMVKEYVSGIEDCIMKLFDDFSHTYSWEPGTAHNIHYYNGFATNKSWKINNKVIVPYMNAWSNYRNIYDPTNYDLLTKLSDIEKVFKYLNGTPDLNTCLEYHLRRAGELGTTKDIQCQFFSLTFYKKGTCHIRFTNEELLKKFNIFGSRQKGWLPWDYGKKKYKDMTKNEQKVIDSFEGESSYAETLMNAGFYIYDPKEELPLLVAN